MLFKVISYNIHRAIGVDRRFQPERIVEILRHHAADVVLLQEVDEGAPRSRELDLAKEIAEAAGYEHRAVGHNVSLRKGRYGNAVLSRWPITLQRNIDLTVGDRKRRGCLHVRLAIEKAHLTPRELEVFNLHLGLSAKERRLQIGALVRAPEFADVTRDASCVLGGDFNDWLAQLHPILREILGFKSATQHRFGYQGTIRTYPAFSPTGALDKIYFRGPIRLVAARSCRLAVSRVASDHRPIVAELELT